jgi:hypothetical protein
MKERSHLLSRAGEGPAEKFILPDCLHAGLMILSRHNTNLQLLEGGMP